MPVLYYRYLGKYAPSIKCQNPWHSFVERNGRVVFQGFKRNQKHIPDIQGDELGFARTYKNFKPGNRSRTHIQRPGHVLVPRRVGLVDPEPVLDPGDGEVHWDGETLGLVVHLADLADVEVELQVEAVAVLDLV